MKIIFCLLLGVFIVSCEGKMSHDREAELVGEYLIESSLTGKLSSSENVGHPNIVRIGNGLKGKMAELKNSLVNDCASELQINTSDKEASHIIYIICSAKPVLGIRLKYDSNYKAFHILGYWTSGL